MIPLPYIYMCCCHFVQQCVLDKIAPKTIFADNYLWGIIASIEDHVAPRMMIKIWFKTSVGKVHTTVIHESVFVRCFKKIYT